MENVEDGAKNLLDSNGSTSADRNDYKLYKKRWLVLATFSLLSMTNEVIWISLSSITSIVQSYYDVEYIHVNWLSMVYMLFYIFVIPTSYILDKYGLRFTIVLGTVLNGLGSTFRCIGANRNGFAFAFIGNSLAALAQCFILFIPPRLAAVWFGDKERSTASAIGVLMNMLGVAVGFLMGATFVPSSEDMNGTVRLGMYQLLISQAVFCTILVVAVVLFVKAEPKTPPSRSQELLREIRLDRQKRLLRSNMNGTEKRDDNVANGTDEIVGEDITANEVSSKPYTHVAPSHVSFFKSFVKLAKNLQFHLIVQAYGLYFGLFAVYNTVLNQMVVPFYPGKERDIGLMGFAAVITGLLGIFLAGVWIDRMKRFKLLSCIVFICCSVSLLLFTILLKYDNDFNGLFVSMCIFGFFSYPYLGAGLEHAAEITYPIPEGTTSGILLLIGNIYGIILTYIVGAVIDKGGSDVGGYIMAGSYILGLVLVLLVKAPLKRTEADRS